MQDSLEYLVKWKGLSYLHLEWISASLARSNNAPWTKSKVNKFLNTEKAQQILDADEQAERKYQEERAALEKAISRAHRAETVRNLKGGSWSKSVRFSGTKYIGRS